MRFGIPSRYRAALSLLAVASTFAAACSSGRVFQVVPQMPEYLLRSPDSRETPFSELLDVFRDTSAGSVALIFGMELRVEKVYFSDPHERTIANYVGTETVRYAVLQSGELREGALESLPVSVRLDDPPVQDLLPLAQRLWSHHRLFLQVLFNQVGDDRRAILLSGESVAALDRLTTELMRDPESLCQRAAQSCTIFPPDTTVAPDIVIVVNGRTQSFPWTTRLGRVVSGARSVELQRLHDGGLIPVKLEVNDPQVLNMFLLPGDHVRWD